MPHQRILDGRYEVGDLIGRGGMADVFQGRDLRLGRRVAIKMMRPDLARDPQFQSRFRREAQSSAALNHPNIVSVYDTGEEQYQDSAHHGVACPFMIMEYVDGRTLRDLLRHDEISVEHAVEWTSGVLAALNYSHDEGIVHRDIKPANVMVTGSGAVKVMDFGIARALSDSAATMTQTQAVVGTAQYLSPEQARGETVDSRSDLYSAGCLLFELITGRPPFVGDSPVAVAYQHVREEAPAPSALNPQVSPALDAVVARSLAKDKADRFQSGLEFRAALQRALLRPDAAPAAAAGGSGTTGTGAAEGSGTAGAGAAAVAGAAGAAALAGGPGSPAHAGSGAPESYGSAAVDLDPGPDTEAMPAVRADEATRTMAAVGGDGGNAGAGRSSAGGAGAGGAALVAGGAGADPGTGAAPSAATPPVPADTGHPLAFAALPAESAGHRPRGRHRVWIPVLVVILALAAVAGGWFLMNELSRRNLEANQVTVPEVANLSQIEAQNALTAAELRPMLEEVHDDDVARDLAVGTEPAAGTTVQRNQEVALLISLGPDQVVIPENLAGQSEATARDTLEELGLSISSVRYVPSADIPRDRLVGTSPELGSTVRSGSSVELQISSGMVEVPQLIDLSRDEARAALDERGLRMTVVEVENEVVRAGTVVAQEQAEGSEVPQGSSVTVEVAVTPAAPTVRPTPSPRPTSASPVPTTASPTPSASPSASASTSATPTSASPTPSASATPTSASPSPTAPSSTAAPTESTEPTDSAPPTGPGNNRGRGDDKDKGDDKKEKD